jgi:argininosuccinate lyase
LWTKTHWVPQRVTGSFPIDRTFTTKESDFETLKYNAVAAQMRSRRKNPGFAMSSVAATLANFLWMFVCI